MKLVCTVLFQDVCKAICINKTIQNIFQILIFHFDLIYRPGITVNQGQ